jgi:hypothetical protein
MTRDQLIARLIVLENEKLNNKRTEEDEEDDEDENMSPNTPTITEKTQGAADEDKSTVDEEDEEDETSDAKATVVTEDMVAKIQMQCKWKECGEMFHDLKKLISHINDMHVGSGKVQTKTRTMIQLKLTFIDYDIAYLLL